MDTSKPIIICGSGASIPFLNSQFNHNGFQHGLPMKLETIIKGNYSIGLNYLWKFGCKTTLTMFNDWQWYVDNSRAIKKLPLIVGAYDPSLKNRNIDRTHSNTILLNVDNKGYYGKEAWGKSFYARQLVGIFAINLAICLGFKNLYLLGYDCKEINGKTHFYQSVANLSKSTPIYVRGKLKDNRMHYGGVGKKEDGKYKTSTYNDEGGHLNKKWFAPLAKEKHINIYNVSPDSAITVFPKLSYDEFYTRVQNNHIDQMEAQEEIKKIIFENVRE